MLRKLVVLSTIVAVVAVASVNGATTNDPMNLAARFDVSPDSYPVIVVRDQFGLSRGTMYTGSSLQLCALGRNAYTNHVAILVPSEATEQEESATAIRCEVARQKYIEELLQKSV